MIPLPIGHSLRDDLYTITTWSGLIREHSSFGGSAPGFWRRTAVCIVFSVSSRRSRVRQFGLMSGRYVFMRSGTMKTPKSSNSLGTGVPVRRDAVATRLMASSSGYSPVYRYVLN
jgi:hypothetical protein